MGVKLGFSLREEARLTVLKTEVKGRKMNLHIEKLHNLDLLYSSKNTAQMTKLKRMRCAGLYH